MIDHIRSAFCRSVAQWLSRARFLERGFHRILARRPLSYRRFALLLLSQLTSPGSLPLRFRFRITVESNRRTRAFLRSIVSIVGTPIEYAVALRELPLAPVELRGSHPAASAAYVAVRPKVLGFTLSGLGENLPLMQAKRAPQLRPPRASQRAFNLMGVRSVASSGLHRTSCLFLFCRRIYARSG